MVSPSLKYQVRTFIKQPDQSAAVMSLFLSFTPEPNMFSAMDQPKPTTHLLFQLCHNIINTLWSACCKLVAPENHNPSASPPLEC